MSADQVSQLYFYYGLTSMVSRAAIGLACNRGLASPLQFYRVAAMVSGVATILAPFAETYSGLLAYFVVFGLAEGGRSTPQNIHLLSVLKPRQRALGFGFSKCVICLTVAIGPPFAGKKKSANK